MLFLSRGHVYARLVMVYSLSFLLGSSRKRFENVNRMLCIMKKIELSLVGCWEATEEKLFVHLVIVYSVYMALTVGKG